MFTPVAPRSIRASYSLLRRNSSWIPDVLFEDNHLLVLNKASGIICQGNGSESSIVDYVNNYLKTKYNKPGNAYVGLVHRLDRDTSGVLILGKTSKAAGRLADAIRKREWTKEYICVVEGIVEKQLVLNNYMTSFDGYVRICDKLKDASCVEASLIARPIFKFDFRGVPLTVLHVNLESGRKHQIRCQLSHIGHPLYGDHRYGSIHSLQLMRFSLHAFRTRFSHPVSTQKVDLVYCNIFST